MTAKEMFEALGYKQVLYAQFIEYTSSSFDEGEFYIIFYDEKYDSNAWLDIETHKAITQQMKELGWLE